MRAWTEKHIREMIDQEYKRLSGGTPSPGGGMTLKEYAEVLLKWYTGIEGYFEEYPCYVYPVKTRPKMYPTIDSWQWETVSASRENLVINFTMNFDLTSEYASGDWIGIFGNWRFPFDAGTGLLTVHPLDLSMPPQGNTGNQINRWQCTDGSIIGQPSLNPPGFPDGLLIGQGFTSWAIRNNASDSRIKSAPGCTYTIAF